MSSAQRNTYLTGFCLFLSLILTRTFYIILDLIHTQGEYAKLKQAVSLSALVFSDIMAHILQTSSKSRREIAKGDQSKVIEELKAKLVVMEAKERDFGRFSVRIYAILDIHVASFVRDPQKAVVPTSRGV